MARFREWAELAKSIIAEHGYYKLLANTTNSLSLTLRAFLDGFDTGVREKLNDPNGEPSNCPFDHVDTNLHKVALVADSVQITDRLISMLDVFSPHKCSERHFKLHELEDARVSIPLGNQPSSAIQRLRGANQEPAIRDHRPKIVREEIIGKK